MLVVFFYCIGTLREPYCCRYTAAVVGILTSNNKLGDDKTNKTMGILRDKRKIRDINFECTIIYYITI